MLDLLISYFNFIIIFFSYLIKKLTFLPPDPPGYIINKKGIKFLVEEKKKLKYGDPAFDNAKISYIDLNKEIEIKSNLLIIYPDDYLKICIIYCHGNCGDIGYCVFDCYFLAIKTKCIVISFEYPHYGPLKDLPLSERNTYKCIQIAYIYANKELDIKSENIFLYGFSLGTGIAFDLACREDFPLAGLILQAPYLSISRVMYNFSISYCFDIFKSCDKAKNLKSKTLFIHGNKDDVVPYVHGRILAKLIPEQYFYEFYTVEKGKHDDIFIKDKENIYKKIIEFIGKFCGEYINYSKKIISKSSNSEFKKYINLNKNNLIDNNSAEETRSQCTSDTSTEKEKKSKKSHYKNKTINKEETCDNLSDNNISSDKNEVVNLENSSNMHYNFEDQNNNLIVETKKGKQFGKYKRKSYSYFKKSIRLFNDEKNIKNKSIKK